MEQLEEIDSSEQVGEKVLRGLFRLLTPEEIDFLCQMTDGMPKVPLTILIEKELKNQSSITKDNNQISLENKKAKILPFKAIAKNENLALSEVIQEETQKEEVIEQVAEMPVAEAGNIEKLEGADLIFKRDQVVIEKKIDRVKFVLEQREKFKKHYLNLKKTEIYNLYSKESDISVGQHELNEEGHQGNLNSLSKGILVDKKCS